MDKSAVISALLAQLCDDLTGLERLADLAIDEATSDQSRAENKYDTRATEASYLAAGHGERLLALRRLIALFGAQEDRTGDAPFDLFELDDDQGGRSWFLLAPDGGGRRVRVDGEEVVVVTPQSPVGEALRECGEGDAVQLGRGGERRAWTVTVIT